MPDQYIYLLASLPMLQFDEKPSFGYDRFLELCRGLVAEEEMRLLELIATDGIFDYAGPCKAVRRWRDFETMLRNELVKIRASRKHVDPEAYLRRSGTSDMELNHIAIKAHRAPSILESEKILDRARWTALDDLAAGHYFDLDCLVAYAGKLLIAAKRQKVKDADKPAALEAALAGGERTS